MNTASDIHNLISSLKDEGDPFVVATVVRTVSVTAAKAGAKAVINKNGEIVDGWVGGGCARGAVLKAAKEALEFGEPKLVSLLPEELANDQPESKGVNIAKNMCPSQGTMDIFVEPILPPSTLLIIGNSPVAEALYDIAPRFGFSPTQAIDIEAFDKSKIPDTLRFIVVSTQGNGDLKALETVLETNSDYVSFVGSRKKVASLFEKLAQNGMDKKRFERLKAPAGLDIGAITPDEIALSIVAELITLKRRGQRQS